MVTRAQAPVPFFFGLHSCARATMQPEHLAEVVVVDLDEGSVCHEADGWSVRWAGCHGPAPMHVAVQSATSHQLVTVGVPRPQLVDVAAHGAQDAHPDVDYTAFYDATVAEPSGDGDTVPYGFVAPTDELPVAAVVASNAALVSAAIAFPVGEVNDTAHRAAATSSEGAEPRGMHASPDRAALSPGSRFQLEDYPRNEGKVWKRMPHARR